MFRVFFSNGRPWLEGSCKASRINDITDPIRVGRIQTLEEMGIKEIIDYNYETSAQHLSTTYSYVPPILNRRVANHLFDVIIKPVQMILFEETKIKRNFILPNKLREPRECQLKFVDIDHRWFRSTAYASLYMGLIRYMKKLLLDYESQKLFKKQQRRMDFNLRFASINYFLRVKPPQTIEEAKALVEAIPDNVDRIDYSFHVRHWLIKCPKEDPSTVGTYWEAHSGINEYAKAELKKL